MSMSTAALTKLFSITSFSNSGKQYTRSLSFVLPIKSSTIKTTSSRLIQPSSFSSSQRKISLVTRVVAEEQSLIQLDTTGGSGSGSDSGDKGGGGGGGGGGRGDDNEDNNEEDNKKMAMSMSQKLTLGYAALVGVGGVMGYVKSGSQKSLAAGGLSALLLYYVYTQLPLRPVFASSLGLGLSAALLVVMASRFKKSGKILPAGLVSFVSLIMTGGYLHGVMRSMH